MSRLHHGNIDRLWTIWQAQDFQNRGLALDGTLTIANIPPSPNATLDSIMHLGIPAGGDLPIKVAMSVTENGHCYMYQ
jgi:tyrosinase